MQFSKVVQNKLEQKRASLFNNKNEQDRNEYDHVQQPRPDEDSISVDV